MKKFPIVSIALIVAGLALVLYADPVVAFASGAPKGQFLNSTSIAGSGQRFGSFNATNLRNINSTNLPSGCSTTSSGAVVCGGGNRPGGILGVDSTTLTIAGVALCGVGIFVSGVESFSGTGSEKQIETVT